ncbi:hypothetical protein ACSBR1_006322 [Camellia fascicularis]
MCNVAWRTLYLEATVKVLPRTYSDHSPLIVYTEGMHSLYPSNRPFRFEAAWMSHPSLLDVINSSWSNMNNNLLDSTTEFTIRVKKWNREVFDNIFKKKRHLLARIEGIQKALTDNFSHSLFTLEKNLITQFNNVLLQEEMLWFQKSRSRTITLGNRNTRYFHISTITKQGKLKINAIKHNEGNWITEKADIIRNIMDYFNDLFKNEAIQHLDHWKNLVLTYFT